MTSSGRPKIGLALGSGGARGLAHIGVLKVLEEHGIPIDFIAGSSMGAMLGGFYAAGVSVKAIEKMALGTDWLRILSIFADPSLDKGLIGGEKVKAFIESYVGGKNFEDCRIPFQVVATDLKTGEIVTLDKGQMAPAIRASISIPLVFKPVEINGRMLTDGALSAPVPVETVRSMGADLVVAVNLDKYHHDEKWNPGWYDIADSSLGILRYHLARLESASADIVVEVDTGGSYWYQFINGKDKIAAGEKAMRELLPRLQEIIKAA
jgi:NTE family protein